MSEWWQWSNKREADDLGFAVVTSTQAKGVLDEDNKMCLGAFNAVPKVENFYSTIDLMIVVGSRLRGHETRDMSLKLPKNLPLLGILLKFVVL